MKLKLKIPLAFAAALMLMFLGALYGIYALNKSVKTYQTTVQAYTTNERLLSQVLVDQKLQVQEWKNILIRGKNPAALNKHWEGFQTHEHHVDDLMADLKKKLPAGQSRDLFDKFAAAHAEMGVKYREGLGSFKLSGFDPQARDNSTTGIDVEGAALLEQAAHAVAADSASVSSSVAMQAKLAKQISVLVMLFVASITMGAALVFSRTVSRPLAKAVTFANRVASGDLSRDVEVNGKDEIAMLFRALKEMQGSLGNVVRQVRANAVGVATANAQIAAGKLDLSSRTEQQAASLEETAASMEEITSTVHRNADNARHALELAGTASSTASGGGAVMSQVVQTMSGISESSAKVAEIVGVIDTIAFQTNILALNAAVEAARAGEQGRGFTVVATEVRTLAQRSATAAKEIKSLILLSTSRVEAGATLIRNAGQIIDDIGGAVQNVATIVGEISLASKEQSTGIEQVNMAVSQMDEVTQQKCRLGRTSVGRIASAC